MPSNVWDQITCPSPYFKEDNIPHIIPHIIRHIIIDVITYSYWD